MGARQWHSQPSHGRRPLLLRLQTQKLKVYRGLPKKTDNPRGTGQLRIKFLLMGTQLSWQSARLLIWMPQVQVLLYPPHALKRVNHNSRPPFGEPLTWIQQDKLPPIDVNVVKYVAQWKAVYKKAKQSALWPRFSQCLDVVRCPMEQVACI